MDWVNQASFAVNKAGVNFIETLQKSCPQGGDKFFQAVTETANPQYAFSLFFPVFSVLNPHLAAKVLMTAMLSEWANALLKWLLMGHRPFWWVREILEQAQPLRTPKLIQTPFTCETGPGNPSGHVMSFAAIAFILVCASIRQISNNKSKKVCHNVGTLLWSLYAVSLVLVSLSRLYVAAHFPHQCVLGAIFGVALGHLVEKTSSNWLTQWSRRKLLKATGLVWAAAFGGYWLQRLLGVDPQWSVKLAFKWCNSPEDIHVSTTPIFALTRDCGTALGLALSLSSMIPKRQPTCRWDQTVSWLLQSLCVVLVLWLSHAGRQNAPTNDVRLFYVSIMLLNAALPLLLLVSVPKITNAVVNKIYGNHNKKNN